ncbi:hypothetical protein JMN32_24700 [Fulvivirga sp. 29W222]|uniref:Uncharacterized protein n=1 Tax=Fulvivirga marina TaxID=2494733 RepID=A0A937G3X4_9BACT|nr:hypothetical protein [Fulvivirga marina]MBL6449535.1 hypothetical protein [Fulvivirga marina]
MIYYKEEQPFETVKLWIILMTLSLLTVIVIFSSPYRILQASQTGSTLPDELLIVIATLAFLIVAFADRASAIWQTSGGDKEQAYPLPVSSIYVIYVEGKSHKTGEYSGL